MIKFIQKNVNLSIIIIFGLVLISGLIIFLIMPKESKNMPRVINSFQDCVDAGNPVAESYPEQCFADGKPFTNPNQKVQNP